MPSGFQEGQDAAASLRIMCLASGEHEAGGENWCIQSAADASMGHHEMKSLMTTNVGDTYTVCVCGGGGGKGSSTFSKCDSSAIWVEERKEEEEKRDGHTAHKGGTLTSLLPRPWTR